MAIVMAGSMNIEDFGEPDTHPDRRVIGRRITGDNPIFVFIFNRQRDKIGDIVPAYAYNQSSMLLV